MNPLFKVHKLNEDGFVKAQLFAEEFSKLMELLDLNCAPGRELALVKTHLEMACIYAKKSMAQEPKNQAKP